MPVSAKIRKRQYEAAVRREEYLARTDRPYKETVSKKPKERVYYGSYLMKEAAKSYLVETQVSERAFNWLTGRAPGADGEASATAAAKLGLKLSVVDTDIVVDHPKFWQPAKIHAGIGLATPTAKKTPWGTRTTKTVSANYSCAISGGIANVTYDSIMDKAKALFTDRAGQLGDSSYRQFYLSPEMMNTQFD
jgi:hypothetical protein